MTCYGNAKTILILLHKQTTVLLVLFIVSQKIKTTIIVSSHVNWKLILRWLRAHEMHTQNIKP